MLRFSAVAVALTTLLLVPLPAAQADLKDQLRGLLGTSKTQPATGLSNPEVVAGLKEALATGTTRAVATLGKQNGFWKNALTQIPLTPALARPEKTLRRIGMGGLVDEFHLSLNRAAEAAVPKAAPIFGDAIRNLTVQDAMGILRGPPDAATQYFRRVSEARLREILLPPVRDATASVGVTTRYKALMQRAGPVLSMVDPQAQAQDLDAFVTQKTLDALFVSLANEEQAIRRDPAARSTAILKKVFGS